MTGSSSGGNSVCSKRARTRKMPCLSEEQRRALLELAHVAIVEAVVRRELPKQIPTEGIFSQYRGVFVTVHVRGHLRGCIGVVEAKEPLGEAIVRCAVSAALQDFRFLPVAADELSEIEVEISLLAPPEPISPQAIEIGTHGILITLNSKRGLLLPQVAVERHLHREQFLEETCHKAGLPRDAWRDPEAKVFGFTCEVFAGKHDPRGFLAAS